MRRYAVSHVGYSVAGISKREADSRSKRLLRICGTVLLICCLVLTACDRKLPGSDENTDDENGNNQTEQFFTLVSATENCRIVYPARGGQKMLKSLEALRERMELLCGVKISAVADSLADPDNKPTILLGATDFSQSEQAIQALAPNTYSITVSEGQVVIAAANEYLLMSAVDRFLTLCTASDGDLRIPADTAYISDACAECVLAEKGKTDYRVVYAAADPQAKSVAETLQKTIRIATGVTLRLTADTEDPEGKEILVGMTDRSQSRAYAVGYYNYRVAYDSETGNIVLTGLLEEALQMFEEIVENLGVEGELRIPEPAFGRSTKGNYGYIPLFNGGNLVAVTPSDMDSYYVHVEDISERLYENYLEKLTGEGFHSYTEREVNGNRFATYTDGHTILNVAYFHSYRSVQIAADTVENSYLPSLENNCSTVVTTPQLTQINGADAFIVRLSDGRFLVIDGGLESQTPNWQSIHDQLIEQNVLEGKPVVAAWIFSHPHTDHFGGFIGFSKNYPGSIELQSVVLNLPVRATYENNTEAAGTADGIDRIISDFKTQMSTVWKDTDMLIAHAGQRFWFGDAMIDMLYTHETLTPNPMKVTNSSTLVYTLSIAGQRIAVLGDAHDDTSEIVYELYGETLKCDIVQVAHHGYNGGHAGMYACIDADTAIWTSPYRTVLDILAQYGSTRNHFDPSSVEENLVMDVNNVQIADETTVMIIPLPHAVGSLPQYVRVLS